MADIEKKDTSEAVKVIVRCRPMNRREKDLSSTKCVALEESNGKCVIFKDGENEQTGKPFTFDACFDTESQQIDVYQDTAQPLVDSVMEGYNGTIFAYGQTGCGKSFTMMGVPTDPVLMGIIPRAFQQIFDTINANTDPSKQFLVQASYIEIYNEEVRDLLAPNHTARLELKEHPEKGVYIQGVLRNTVNDVDQITKLMDQGTGNRSVGSTLMNADSSRSHSIFMVEVETSEPVANGKEGDETIRQGVLNLVDLAGSERQGKTGATGQRLKEAAKINLSLSALGNVISALVAGKVHIPYRDSKLTRLLQNSLGGNAKTVMIAAISPAHDNYEETLSTLRYANRAKNIKNKPKVNEDPRDAMLRDFQEEIKRLRELLSQSGIDTSSVSTSAGPGASGSGGNASRGVGIGMEHEKKRMIDDTKNEMQKIEVERKVNEEESKYMQEQLEMERAEQTARLAALEMQANEAEEARLDILRRQEELEHAKGLSLAEAAAARAQLDEERAALEEELERERETQMALEDALQEKETEAQRMKLQFQQEEVERERRQKELQDKLGRLETEHNAARKELEKKLKKMEQQLIKGGEITDSIKQEAQARVKKAHKRMEKMKEENARIMQQRQEQESREMMMKEHISSTNEEIHMQSDRINVLQHQLMDVTSEMEDLRDEFATEKQDYLKTIKELTRELSLYKTIVRSVYNSNELGNVLRNAKYDDKRNKWILGEDAAPVYSNTPSYTERPPNGSYPGGGINNVRARMYSTGGGISRGIADTSPQDTQDRADFGWKKSIRSEYRERTPSVPSPMPPGMMKPKPPAKPQSEVNVADLELQIRRPAFVPISSGPDSRTSSGQSSRPEPSPQGLMNEFNSKPRKPAFVAADSDNMPGQFSHSRSFSGNSNPNIRAQVEESLSQLDTVRARPGFNPAPPPSNMNMSGSMQIQNNANDPMAMLSATQRRGNFAPAPPPSGRR